MADAMGDTAELEAPEHEAQEAADDSEDTLVAGLDRNEELSNRASIKTQLLETFDEVTQGYQDAFQRQNDQLDYWDMYNCILNGNQFYTGNAKIFVPVVHNAINARKTRFTNQIFPVSGRYVEATSEDGTVPHAMVALLDSYVRQAKLRTKMMPALCRNGDIEGQYNICVSWETTERHVVHRIKSPVVTDDGIDTGEEVDDIAQETLEQGCPQVEVLSDLDVMILPETADSVDEAIACGGSVTVIRRWTKAQVMAKMKSGEIRGPAGKSLLAAFKSVAADTQPNKPQKMLYAAGIQKGDGGQLYAQVYETWSRVRIGSEDRICRSFYGGSDNILSCKRNPYWCDRVPIFSVPLEKVQGAAKGISKVRPVAMLQYFANDTINEAADSAAYALLPIIMTDPEKNPRIGSMILSQAAVWETDPRSTAFAQFPELWKQGLELVASTKAEIFQTLSVNPAAITQQGVGSGQAAKRNQAQIAQEQQVDILSTADAVTVIEEGILTPMLTFMLELDHQYRNKTVSVRQYGEMGVQATIQEVEPIQMNKRYAFRWFGVEAARNAQQIQQQIAGMNVIRGIPPQQLNGYTVNLVPIITQLVENTFGPRLAPLIFVSPADQMPVPVDQENMLLREGFEIKVHPMDDDQAHIQAHMQLLQDPAGGQKNARKIQAHIFQHMQQAQQKAAAAAPQPGAGAPGIPGGQGPGGPQPAPGVAGTPRIGAQPAGPRTQGPPGMIPQDSMQDPGAMPRQVG